MPGKLEISVSIRADAVYSPIDDLLAVFSLKTGCAKLTLIRFQQIQSACQNNIPVIEIKP